MTLSDTPQGATTPDPIPADEEALLARVRAHLAERAVDTGHDRAAIDEELISLRDQIAEARLEDVPALIAQMERLQGVASRRAEATGAMVDPRSPYFGHLRLRETTDGRTFTTRDVLIGRGTHVDSRKGVRIVDWRHAPVSQLYYRYPEGSPYEERFGDRDVEGEVEVRRTVTIDRGQLLRVSAPQGVFVRRQSGWSRLDARNAELAGGQGSATRPSDARGVLGTGGDADQRLDRHLPEIAALIDPRQFELITAPDSGLVVIQGGAGSGKTTIGLHRIAYLAYAQPKRFLPERMLVVTYGRGLAAYMSEVLPSLGVDGVDVTTFSAWASKQRRRAVPWLRADVADDTPSVVTRMKKHPALMHELERRAAAAAADPRARKDSRGVVMLWAELLTDLDALQRVLVSADEDPMRADEVRRAWQWCSERCPALLEQDREEKADRDATAEAEAEAEGGVRDAYDDEDVRGDYGVDGLRTDEERATLDVEDDALLVRAAQLLRGPIRSVKKGRDLLAHLFVDEAQDLAPIELAVLLAQTSPERSVTLAGDVAQKLFLDNGFRDWKGVLAHLGMEHITIEPLRIAYRSTREVLEVARHALGPLADPEPPVANRSGAPVEAHVFPDQGAAVAFLADALRPLFAREPRATVAVLARWPEQADAYWDGLSRAEIPNLRRVRVQDFAFRPGVEVTDVRQVKGLEYDYVILVDANANVFPADDEARHLFHIAATRAAHQLWLVVTGVPSPLVPPALVDG